MKIQLTNAQKLAIHAANTMGTLYVPQTATGGAKTSDEFFNAVKGKTVEVELLEVGAVTISGRNNSKGIATTDQVFRSVCKVKVGNETSEVRLHLCDIVGLMKSGGKGSVTFGTYKPENSNNTYLVPVAASRASAAEVVEYVDANAEVLA